jgi:hypothetical protein
LRNADKSPASSSYSPILKNWRVKLEKKLQQTPAKRKRDIKNRLGRRKGHRGHSRAGMSPNFYWVAG